MTAKKQKPGKKIDRIELTLGTMKSLAYSQMSCANHEATKKNCSMCVCVAESLSHSAQMNRICNKNNKHGTSKANRLRQHNYFFLNDNRKVRSNAKTCCFHISLGEACAQWQSY